MNQDSLTECQVALEMGAPLNVTVFALGAAFKKEHYSVFTFKYLRVVCEHLLSMIPSASLEVTPNWFLNQRISIGSDAGH